MNSSTSVMVTVAPLDVLERRAVTFADLKLRPPFFPRLPWCRAEKNNNGGHMEDEERRLSPADAEDLILRVAAEEAVSSLSMDAVFDPTPSLELTPWPPGGDGPCRDYTSVLLRSMGACVEPSLSPTQSIQWAAYVVVRILARVTRHHPDPRSFEPLLRGMCELRRRHDGWHPMRRAVGWLLTHELQRDPTGTGSNARTGVDVEGIDDPGMWTTAAEWGAALARDMANNGIHDVFTGGDGDGYADTLFGKFVPAMSGDEAEDGLIRQWFGVFGN